MWSNASGLAAAHADGGTIVPKAGKFLAIPTENVGRKGGRRRTPVDIESEFNQDLVIKPTRHPNVFLALVRAVRARSGRGFRRASARRRAHRTARADVHPVRRSARRSRPPFEPLSSAGKLLRTRLPRRAIGPLPRPNGIGFDLG
jgi:hypothetical protein